MAFHRMPAGLPDAASKNGAIKKAGGSVTSTDPPALLDKDEQ